jgi:propanediol dehydratase small subunit
MTTGPAFDPETDYPIGSRRPDLVQTPDGTPLADVTLAALRDGRVDGRELRATPQTLSRQAAVAHAAGRPQLAENLARASELARVPDEEILEIYTALRPHRSTEDDLLRWAARLEHAYDARATAAFVREAIPVYAKRGLLLEADRGRQRAAL